MLRRRLATPARLLVCCFAASIALETIHATQPPVDAPQQQPPVAHAAAVERAPSIGSPASNASVGSQQLLAASNPLRLWIDDFFFAKGETALLQEAIAAAGADTAVLAGVTRNRVLQLKSYQLTGKADVLWTGRVVRGMARHEAAGRVLRMCREECPDAELSQQAVQTCIHDALAREHCKSRGHDALTKAARRARPSRLPAASGCRAGLC